MIMKNDKTQVNITPDKFKFVGGGAAIHDEKFETKPVGYFKDAFRRFCKNKSSVVAAVIIAFLLLFAAIGPFLTPFDVTFSDVNMMNKLPKSTVFSFLGWDGCKNESVKDADFIRYSAIEAETGEKVIVKNRGSKIVETQMGINVNRSRYYDVYVDGYTKTTMVFVQLTVEQYAELQKYQDEHKVQIIYPAVTDNDGIYKDDANVWYKTNESGSKRGLPLIYDSVTGEYTLENNYIAYGGNDGYTSSMRIEGETPLYDYCIRKSNNNVVCRINYLKYFEYKYGKKPVFFFGTDQYGKDIFANLASGARFSLLFACAISVINLVIGAIYGAVEGYYGGALDLTMERISDILSGVPFMVVVTLFKLHVASSVGPVVTLLFAFVLTGWIGMASTTRMQFYRYKNQEYVLAARTLGASDARIMFKHIFPNALGTLVTSCVLVIPGVIFSESSLSYLGIINLGTSKITSVGTLLSSGQGYLTTFPHIILFPALFVSLLMISFNLFGNGLRDAFNPSLRGTED